MEATLVLKIDADLATRAQEISKDKGKTLEMLVEELLSELVSQEAKPSLVDEMISMVKDAGITDDIGDYKTFIRENRYNDWLASQNGSAH